MVLEAVAVFVRARASPIGGRRPASLYENPYDSLMCRQRVWKGLENGPEPKSPRIAHPEEPSTLVTLGVEAGATQITPSHASVGCVQSSVSAMLQVRLPGTLQAFRGSRAGGQAAVVPAAGVPLTPHAPDGRCHTGCAPSRLCTTSWLFHNPAPFVAVTA